jgi:hypothetical protein
MAPRPGEESAGLHGGCSPAHSASLCQLARIANDVDIGLFVNIPDKVPGQSAGYNALTRSPASP